MYGNYSNMTQLLPNGTSELSLLPPKPDGSFMPPPFMATPEDAPIARNVFNIIEVVINVYIINALSVIGSIGNIISIVILYRHGFKSTTNIILVSMAVADLLLVLTMPLRKISLIISHFDEALAMTVDSFVVRYHFLTLNRVWSLTSNSHVAIISVERLLAVYFPFQVGRWVTVSRMTTLVFLTHLTWYLALIPLFTMFDLQWIWQPLLNETIAVPSITPFYHERENLFNDYNSYFINISVGAFLLLLTLVCCMTIAVKILRMGRKRSRLSGRSSLQSKVYSIGQSGDSETGSGSATRKSQLSAEQEFHNRTSSIDLKALKMLMAVCVTFLILIFPTFFLAFFQGLYPKLRDPYWHNVNFVATSASMLLISINSSINFVLYIMFSQKFNRTFMTLFTCNRRGKKRNGTPKTSHVK